ncbi:S49 family peptidase [Kiloniella laminariae]|uniref:S49 family peptidase n=1 Tax=Kiloniella laminariae TaxID=454162 RepID=A0ABT4LGQ8_9PROT|nr:S49 family peptidase [Kiloniella laminariae]MCZ4279526.1 S49 family peptidase [Kiloniella laminariae]
MKFKKLLRKLPIKHFRNPPAKVAVVALNGVIGGGSPLRPGLSLATVEDQLESAFKIDGIKAVALTINSPGGSPVQSDLIGRRIRDLADKHEVKVYAFCEDVAASGGYWLACAADEIYAMESSVIGSIGVISAGFGFPELIKKHGIERRVRTAGDLKSTLDPFEAEKPADVKRLEKILTEIHENFMEWVRERRMTKLKGEEKELFSGLFWTGKTAKEHGLIDGLGSLHQIMRFEYGDKVKLIKVEGKRSWLKGKLGLDAAVSGLSGLNSGDIASGLLSSVEERAHWNRFGL